MKMAAPAILQIVGRMSWMILFLFGMCKSECKCEPNDHRVLTTLPSSTLRLGGKLSQA